MRFILTLLIGVALGIAAVWYFNHNKNNSQFSTAGQEIKSTAQNAGNALSDKLRSWNLDRENITNELAHTGSVIREKAERRRQGPQRRHRRWPRHRRHQGQYVKDSDLSAWDIHVSTTDGVVTISGTVASPELIGKAMAEALETAPATRTPRAAPSHRARDHGIRRRRPGSPIRAAIVDSIGAHARPRPHAPVSRRGPRSRASSRTRNALSPGGSAAAPRAGAG